MSDFGLGGSAYHEAALAREFAKRRRYAGLEGDARRLAMQARTEALRARLSQLVDEGHRAAGVAAALGWTNRQASRALYRLGFRLTAQDVARAAEPAAERPKPLATRRPEPPAEPVDLEFADDDEGEMDRFWRRAAEASRALLADLAAEHRGRRA